MRPTFRWLFCAAVLSAPVLAQQVISAHSGLVHYVEGKVYVADQLVERKFGQFPLLRDGEEVRTEDGRAEVLLTPGVFMRIADHSSVRFVSTALSDTRAEVLTGSIMVECDELHKGNAVTLLYKGNAISIEKHGLYRLETAPAQFRVYDGEATVEAASGPLTLKKGKGTSLDGVLLAEKFDVKQRDELYAWSAERSNSLAMASRIAAQNVSSRGWRQSAWLWDPTLNICTFLPGSGISYSPFGFGYWSPVYAVYYAAPVYRSGNGTGFPSAENGAPSRNGAGQPSGGFSGGGAAGGGGATGGGFSGGGFGGGARGGGGARSVGR